MTNLELQCATILREARSATHGVVVLTNDPAKARATFYRVRKMLGDVDLAEIQIRVSPNDTEHELWLINRSGIGPTFSPNAA